MGSGPSFTHGGLMYKGGLKFNDTQNDLMWRTRCAKEVLAYRQPRCLVHSEAVVPSPTRSALRERCCRHCGKDIPVRLLEFHEARCGRDLHRGGDPFGNPRAATPMPHVALSSPQCPIKRRSATPNPGAPVGIPAWSSLWSAKGHAKGHELLQDPALRAALQKAKLRAATMESAKHMRPATVPFLVAAPGMPSRVNRPLPFISRATCKPEDATRGLRQPLGAGPRSCYGRHPPLFNSGGAHRDSHAEAKTRKMLRFCWPPDNLFPEEEREPG